MNTNDKTNWLTGLLTGWGIKESWAKIIAGAIIGALTAAGAMTLSGCGTTVTVSSEQGMLQVDSKGVIIYTPPVQEFKK